jgi:putative heme-binding domain-containing protein
LQSQPLTPETLDALRKAVDVPELRRVAIELLSNYPNAKDYKTYLDTLGGSDRTIWGIAWRGLQSLPVTLADEEWPVMAKLVSETCNSSCSLPQDAVLVRTRSAAKQLGIANAPASNNWNEWGPFLKDHLAEEVYGQLSQPKAKLDWAARMRQAERLQGNLEAGKTLYDQKCASCHGAQTALGPSLAGVAKRFSRMDLGTAIFEPSRDVSDRYRAVRILTVDGEIYTGLVVYSAADGTTISTATGQIIRVNKEDLEELAYSTESIMPSGLLDDNNDQEIANLMAYLSSL